MIQTVKRKLVIGMMRHIRRPNQLAVAAAFSAKMIDCEFFYFTPQDINFSKRKIEGLFYEDGQWIKRLTDFPNVVDNAPSRKSSQEIYEALEKHIPLTLKCMWNEKEIQDVIQVNGIYSDIVIPFQLADSVDRISAFLDRYETIVIKSVSNNQQKAIRWIEKKNEKYVVKENHLTFEMNRNQMESYFEQCIEKRYVIQAYIQSLTEEGLPYDIRIHVRRGKEGKWSLVKIYPRISLEGNVTDDLGQASVVMNLQSFLAKEFHEKSIEIEQRLNKLAVEFPIYLQETSDKPLDALGLDVSIDQYGKLWLLGVNLYPESTMFELESQQVAMEYAKYLANATENEEIITEKNKGLIPVDEVRINKKVIGMFSPVKTISNLKGDCAAAAAFFDCEFFYFTPVDINYEDKEIVGQTYRNGEWVERIYCYETGIDAIYDRVRLVGLKKYAKQYSALAHIPTTHTRTGTSLNKLLVYDKFIKEGSLKKYLIPYEHYTNTEAAIQFLEKHKEIIVKPDVGVGGSNLYYINKQENLIKVVRKEIELNLSPSEFRLWLEETIGTTPYVVQKYINTRTVDGQPFDIRVHMMRNDKNTWDFVVVYPRIGIGFEKITPMTEGGYMGRWRGFVERNFGVERFKEINLEMRKISRKMIEVFEKEFNQNISELGIDLAISKEGEIYLLELNLHRPGIAYYEFDVAKRAIGYAKYLAEQND